MGLILTRNQKDILAMSKAEYLTHIGSVDDDTRLQVAAAIFKIDARSSRPTILLLRRRQHDHHRPGVFEIPNGRVDDNDFIISDSIARAVQKQSSLKVFRIEAMLRESRWTDKRPWLDGEEIPGTTLTGLSKNMQLNWAVAVDNTEDVDIRSDEHDEFVWASWNTLSGLNLRQDTRDLAQEALTWAARRLCG
jgi:8-oxo-dGTP pyrophosphatase MutT (NUDIX family)